MKPSRFGSWLAIAIGALYFLVPLICTFEFSLRMYHIEAKNAAKKAGARGVFNAPCNEDGWINGAMTADFLEIRKTAERLRDRLARGKVAHVFGNVAGPISGLMIAQSLAGEKTEFDLGLFSLGRDGLKADNEQHRRW